ncbi:Uncharacterised protein [Serratia fonticola]|uniref:Uncharacterized protein n=1 Tax=Serratia fonticola TaxID=47917 RepID=A0A4U9WPU5_SERFO|nr:Uncharacterised protein [Serratia fonticola]
MRGYKVNMGLSIFTFGDLFLGRGSFVRESNEAVRRRSSQAR